MILTKYKIKVVATFKGAIIKLPFLGFNHVGPQLIEATTKGVL